MTAPAVPGARVIVESAIERWLPVVGYEGLYEVSDQGQVRSVDRMVPDRGRNPRKLRGRVLKQQPDRGYFNVSLSYGSSVSCYRVHKLVMEAFVGPCPEGQEIAHNDGRPGNNRLTNLRYATHQGNLADKIAHGTHRQGENHPGAILTAAQVLEIRAARATGEMLKVLADRYGVVFQTVSEIALRKTWAWLPDDVAS